MKVYFVRHAETAYNSQRTHQPAEAPLSECGVKQAHIVGRKFRYLPVEIILSSPNTRAMQTADIINSYINKKNKPLYQLRETRRPSILVGKKKDSVQSKEITKLFYQKALDSRWYYSDEENFNDLVARAKRVIRYISSQKEKNILVVSHSTFIKLLICLMMHKEKLTPEIFYSFIKFFGTKNTGITLCQRKKSGNWRLVTWNDYTHLRMAKQMLDFSCNTTVANQ